MKATLLFTLSLAFAPMMAQAACPDLAGRYQCSYMGFIQNVAISQTVRGGVTIYQVDNGGEIFADGIRHQTPTLHPILDRHARNYSYIATCNGNKLGFTGKADLIRGGQGDVDGDLTKQSATKARIKLHLVTPDNDMDIDLACEK